jgi:hypothetical protein
VFPVLDSFDIFRCLYFAHVLVFIPARPASLSIDLFFSLFVIFISKGAAILLVILLTMFCSSGSRISIASFALIIKVVIKHFINGVII